MLHGKSTSSSSPGVHYSQERFDKNTLNAIKLGNISGYFD